jgi:hypothetical protein
VGARRDGISGESSGRGDSPAEETSTSLLAAGVFRGVKKSAENLLRLKVVGVEEKRNDPPLPLLTGAMFPNCFDVVFNCFGGLSVAFSGPLNVKGSLRRKVTFLCRCIKCVVERFGEGGIECEGGFVRRSPFEIHWGFSGSCLKS